MVDQQALLDELKQKQLYIEELEAKLAKRSQQTDKQDLLIAIQLSDTCRQLIHTIQQRIKADRVTLFLVDHAQQEIVLSVMYGSQSKVSLDYTELLEGLSGQVLKTQQPILSQSPTDEIQNTDLYERRLRDEAESLIVVPLFAYDGDYQYVVGTITAINHKHNTILTSEDIEVVQTLIHATQIRLDTVQIFQDTFQAQYAYKIQYDIDHNISQGVCLISKETLHVLHVNSRFEELFRCHHKAVINKPSEFFPNEELIRLREQFPQTSIPFDYWQSEIHNTHADGSSIWCIVNVSSTNHPQYGWVWVCVYTDITQRKREEERYHHQERLLDFVMDAVISADPQFNILTWNKAAERIYGWTEEEVIGQYATDLFKTQYFDGTTPEDTQKQYRERGIWRGEMIHHRKDGTPIPVRGASGAIRNDQAEAIGAVTVLRDISDELEAEQALKASEERYRIISELTSDYAYLDKIDEYGRWYHVWITAESFTRLTGYDPDLIESRFDLYHPDDVEQVKQDIRQTQEGEDTEGEYRIITKSGDLKWLYVRRRVLWDEDHKQILGFYGAGKDITSRKQAEQHLVEYNREKERVAVLQNFIQDASHDLKTPLSTINTSIYILQKLLTTDKQLNQLGKLEFNVNRLTKLIEDMFNMSRLDMLQHLSLTTSDLNPMLLDILMIFRPIAADKQIEIHNELQESPLMAQVNEDSLLQAISNIVENAIWFTSENGQITIRSYQDNDWVVIVVEDNGIGIASDEIPNIFTRFYRGDKSRGTNTIASTGLGLSISRKIIELHGGEIDVESRLGEGACFYIRLPLAT